MSNPHFEISGRTIVIIDADGAVYDFLAETNERLAGCGLGRCEFVVRAPDRMNTLSLALEGLRRSGGDRLRQAENDFIAIQAGAILASVLRDADLSFGKDFLVNINVSGNTGFVNTTVLDPALRSAWVEANQSPARRAQQAQTQTVTGGLDDQLTAVAMRWFSLGNTETAPAGAPTAVQIAWYNAQIAKLAPTVPAAGDNTGADGEIPF